MTERPPVNGTSRALTIGALASSGFMLVGLLTAAATDLDDASRLLSLAGVVVLLATPAIGLVVTVFELRPFQPRAAVLAMLVLTVLGVATAVALLSRP